MSLSIVMYGSTECDDTERIREHLTANKIPFTEVNLDHNPEAERFVAFINGGFRSTPTLVMGEGQLKTILTEPTNDQFDDIFARLNTT
jgi:mycoredoxin